MFIGPNIFGLLKPLRTNMEVCSVVDTYRLFPQSRITPYPSPQSDLVMYHVEVCYLVREPQLKERV